MATSGRAPPRQLLDDGNYTRGSGPLCGGLRRVLLHRATLGTAAGRSAEVVTAPTADARTVAPPSQHADGPIRGEQEEQSGHEPVWQRKRRILKAAPRAATPPDARPSAIALGSCVLRRLIEVSRHAGNIPPPLPDGVIGVDGPRRTAHRAPVDEHPARRRKAPAPARLLAGEVICFPMAAHPQRDKCHTQHKRHRRREIEQTPSHFARFPRRITSILPTHPSD